MRIALITNTFFPKVGGTEYVVHNLADTWSRQGHRVCVFNAVSGESQPERRYEVRRYKVPFSYFKLPPHWFPFGAYCARSIRRQLEEFRPDFISAHTGYPLGVWLSRIRPLPRFLITCHGRELTRFPWGVRSIYGIDDVLARALNAADGVVAISTQARLLMEEIGVERGKIINIPNGVDLARFRQEVSWSFRDKMKIPRSARLVLSVGRNHPQKAYDQGIKAFHLVASRIPDAAYVIVGREVSNWRTLVGELGLQDRVLLVDGLHGDDLVAAYQQADVFFSPSIWEMMPLVVLEGMATSLPLLVTNISGSQDLVDDGGNGLVVEPGNIEGMACGLEALLQDEAMRKAMGEASRAKSERFSWEVISEEYLRSANNRMPQGTFHA